MQDRRRKGSDEDLWAMVRYRFWHGAWVYAAAIGLLLLVGML